MSNNMKQILFWTPRLLSALFAVFLSLFALDVFDAGYSLGETMLALLIHLIPTIMVLLILALSWRWEWVGGILFPVLGVLYLVVAQGQHWSAYLLIAGPLFVIGALFWLDWFYREQLHPKPGI